MSLSCQPLDGSTFGVFITGETVFSQVLLQDRKDENHWVPNPSCMGDGLFPN